MSLFAVVMPVVVEVEVVFLVNLDTSSESLTGYHHQDNNLLFSEMPWSVVFNSESEISAACLV